MNLYSLRAPQLGEGIKSVVVAAFLKKQGDHVRKDEPILLVETRKAAMEIELPVSGIIHEFKVPLREEVPVGVELLNIRIEDENKPNSNGQDNHSKNGMIFQGPIKETIDLEHHQDYSEQTVSARQYILIKAMRSSSHHVIPAFIQRSIDASIIQKLRKQFRASASSGNQIPASTEIFAWCVLQSMKRNPRFRSLVLDDDKTVREYKYGCIGIAIGLPNDDLTTVRIAEDDYDDFGSFIGVCKKKIAEAKAGIEHNGPHFVTISDLCALGIGASIPVIVSPAVATLAIGTDEYASDQDKRFTLSLSFDHRLINGAGAAGFLSDLKKALNEIKPVMPAV